MPKLPQPTAQGVPGILSLPSPGPDTFGAEGFHQVSQFGHTLQDIGEKVQAQQDETDLIEKVTAHNERLAQIPDEILNNPEIAPGQRYKQFLLKATASQRALEAGASPAVIRAFGNHATKALSQAIIHFQADDITERTNKARAALMESQAKSAEREAFALANGNDAVAKYEREQRQAALARSEDRRIISPIERQQATDRDNNRKFELLATQNPELTIAMTEAVKAGKSSEIGMDPTKATYYGNLAYNVIHQRELAQQSIDARKAKEREQLANATEQNFYQRYTERNAKGQRVWSTQQLLEEAGASMALGSQKPQTVSFLNSMLNHERSAEGQPVDYAFYNRTILPNIYKGAYKTEMDVLQAGGDKLGSHMDAAINQFQKYRSLVTAKVAQDFQFGEQLIRGTFAVPPGATIDPPVVKDTRVRALDRFNTWYTAQVERATTEGAQVLSTLDIQAEARKIRDEEYRTLEGNLITILETTEATLQYKSVAEIEKAHENGKLTMRETTRALQNLKEFEYLKTLSSGKKTATQPSKGRIGKD